MSEFGLDAHAAGITHAAQILQQQAALKPDDPPALRQRINDDAKSCLHILEQCESDQGWRVASDKAKSSLRTLYRHGDSKVHSLKYEADFDCTVAQLVSMAREFDLIADWNKHVKQSVVLDAPELFRVAVYGSVFFPW